MADASLPTKWKPWLLKGPKSFSVLKHVNVQPHSGSQANIASYLALLEPGDKILGMNLSHGGHLTHGHPLNFSGRFFEIVPYGVEKVSERI